MNDIEKELYADKIKELEQKVKQLEEDKRTLKTENLTLERVMSMSFQILGLLEREFIKLA